MPLREDILDPIPGDQPAGIDLRRDTRLLIFDKIKEARRQDDELSQGAWVSERKLADFPSVVRIAQDALATVSKDLQLAVWLTEALLATERFGGLRQGLDLSRRLVAEFWDHLYPEIDDGDREVRATPLNWIGYALDFPVRSSPLVTGANYSWLSYQESRKVGYEEQAKTDKERTERKKLIEKENKLSAEAFDKIFATTPKAFYIQTEKDIDASLASLSALEKICDEKFEDDAPSFGKLRSALEDVRRTAHVLLEKKREKEPDPVIEEVAAAPETQPGESALEIVAAEPVERQPSGDLISAEPTDRRQAVAAILAAASFLRKREPHSPAPYLLLRGLRWGELRTGAGLEDSTLLEAPPTELRQKVKRLALAADWRSLLEACEAAMAHPCSRAWLDLQRLSVTACQNLGSDYAPIAAAIRTELRALLTDLPELLDATLLDDTPAANPETRAWLLELGTPLRLATAGEDPAQRNGEANGKSTPVWLLSASDSFALAKQALAAGSEERAFAIMRNEIGRQRSGRARFRRTMQLIELALAAGKDAIAQPLLEDVAALIETHKLDAWEDPEQVAGDLLRLMRNSKKLQASAPEKQKLFERICRLDPVLALSAG
jgi:type VI secretion system protein ImpA